MLPLQASQQVRNRHFSPKKVRKVSPATITQLDCILEAHTALEREEIGSDFYCRECIVATGSTTHDEKFGIDEKSNTSEKPRGFSTRQLHTRYVRITSSPPIFSLEISAPAFPPLGSIGYTVSSLVSLGGQL
jgi:hypothetical protein